MLTTTADPASAERAKASSPFAREAFKRRLDAAKRTLDVRAQIARHPVPAVGIAFALGLLVGLRSRRRARARVSSSRRSAALAILGAVAVRIVRDVALGQASELAKRWWSDRNGEPPTQTRESRMSQVEPFLEH